MMRLRNVLIAAAIFCAASDPAHADPITTAVAAAVDWIVGSITAVTWADVAAFALKTAAVVGLNYVISSLAGKPHPAINGVNGTIQTGGTVPRSIMVGNYATAGLLLYANSWGTDGNTPNAFLTYVVKLSDFPITSLNDIWVGSTKGNFDTGQTPVSQGYPILAFRKSGVDNLWVRFYDGTQSLADSFLTSTFGSDPNYPWTTNMVGHGVAYVIVTARLNPQVFPSGFPQYKFALRGAKLYDQRLDSTAGGSGPQRFSDQTTWAYSENPVLIVNNILRAISYGGQPLYGLQGLPASRVPSASWFAAMNECDATINDIGGGSHAQYRCGAEISVDVQPADMIDALLKGCNGRIAEIGGVYKVLVGAASASVYSFTDSDIIVSQPQTFDPFPPMDKAVNGITATYPEPAEAWANKDSPLRKYQAAVDEDGEIFSNVNYATVYDASQVQRLQDAALGEAGRLRRHAHTMPPPAFVLEPLDTTSWTSARNGYAAKAMLVNEATINENLDIPVSLSEIDPADYDFDPNADYLPVNQTPLVEPDLPPLLGAVTGLTAVQSADTITLSWNGFSEPSLILGYGIKGGAGTPDWTASAYIDALYNGTSFSLAAPAAGAHRYHVRAFDQFKRYGTDVYVDINVVVSGIAATRITGQLTDAQIAAIAAAKITGTLTDAQLAAISAAKITGTLTDAQLSAIAAAKITGAIGTTQISDDAVTAPKIAAGAVTASEIAANTITAAQIAANTITAAQIASGSITSAEIAGGTIVAGNIAAEAITTSKIAAGAVTANELTAGAVVAGKVSAGAVNASSIIVDDLIVTSHLTAHAVTDSTGAYDAGTESAPTANVWADVISINFTSDGSPALIIVSTMFRNDDNGDHATGIRLQEGGADIWSAANTTVQHTSHLPFTFAYLVSPAAGSRTYTLQWKPNSTAERAKYRSIGAIPFKR